MSVEFEQDEHEMNVDPIEPLTGTDRIYEKIYEMAGKFASTDFGQFFIDKVDRVFSVLEATAKWSLPVSNGEESETEPEKTDPAQNLQRPLPWIPFLIMIIILRIVRLAVSIAAVLIGNSPVAAEDMVHFIQMRRRKLRAIKYRGIRVIRTREKSNDNKPTGIMSKVTSLLSVAICRPGINKDTSAVEIVVEKNEIQTNKEALNAGTNQVCKKRKIGENMSDTSDDELDVHELLNKYGNKDSEIDDADFAIPQYIKSDSSSASSTEDEEEVEHTTTTNGSSKVIDNDVELVMQNGGHHEIKFPVPMSEIKEEQQHKATYNNFSPSYLKKNLETSDDYTSSTMPAVSNGTHGNNVDCVTDIEPEFDSNNANNKTISNTIPFELKGSPEFHADFDSYMSNDTMTLLNQLQEKVNDNGLETVTEKNNEEFSSITSLKCDKPYYQNHQSKRNTYPRGGHKSKGRKYR